MKKYISLLLVAVLAVSLVGCKGETKPAEGTDIRIGGLKGPTSMGLVNLIDASEKGETVNKYDLSVSGSADEVTPKLLQGDLDVAAIPANLAAILYNNTEKVKILAVNTLGVIYIVEKGNSVSSFQDLKGKTIYATGKGSTPEYNLRYLLSKHGLDPDKDVTIEWKSEPTEIVALFSQSDTGIAMLPQPYVTVAQSKIENLNIVIDLSKEWDDLKTGSLMITGVLVANKDFAEAYPDQINEFLKEYKTSTELANSNIKETAALVEKYDIVPAAIAEKAIPYCNITYMEGKAMREALEGYLNVLFEQNPQSVGGQIPGDDFYYGK